MKEITKIIVDLYEIRASSIHKYMSKHQLVHDQFKYQFFSSVIANLSQKYNVSEQDIDEELLRRLREDDIINLITTK